MNDDHYQDRLLNIRELAALLGIAVGSAYHLVSQGRIPEVCIVRLSRRCIRFRESEIWKWLGTLSRENGTSKIGSKVTGRAI